jgi:uncharacterized protein YdhG (YjbR/CyaY superfamily)
MNPAPQTVDDYIDGFPPATQAILQAVRAAVLRAAPGATECISYRMPAVFLNGVVVYYAAFKNHLGVFPPVEDADVKAKVAPYEGPKGNLQFPYSSPIPYDLLAEVVKARLRANLSKAAEPARKKGRPRMGSWAGGG